MSKNTEKTSKTSSADYPVDPEERSHQEARLKKAAAAGANAAKSPIPGLRLQLPVAGAVPQKESETQPAAALAPTAEPAAEPVETIAPDFATESAANLEILAELRKLTTSAELQRRTIKWGLALAFVGIAAIFGILLVVGRPAAPVPDAVPTAVQPDWSDVDRNVHLGNFEKALALGEELVAKAPQDPEAHIRLARALLAQGNLDKAQEHYAEAFRLFPSEDNQKLLEAIQKRIKADKP